MNKPKAIIVSGYFNPIHKGHIEYFKNAKKFADKLIVIVNNDKQRILKGSKEFMLEDERLFIVQNIKAVDFVYMSVDHDRSVNDSILKIHNELKDRYKLFFGNGGDRTIILFQKKKYVINYLLN